MEKLIEHIKQEEGFRSRVYQCTEGYDTIGFGFAIKDLELTEDICELILKEKLIKLYSRVDKQIPFFKQLPVEIQDVILNMCYQMGVTGVSKFKKTLAYLENKEFKKAAIEMLDSRWARQTPNRARKLSNIVKNVSR